NEAMKAAEILAEKGIEAEIIKLSRLDKAEYPLVYASAAKTDNVIIAEESARRGGIGTRIMAGLLRNHVCVKNARGLDLGNGIVEHGSVSQLRQKYGIDAEAIARLYMEWKENEESKA
ncbi:MAG: hypothetical protein IKV79_06995, partial [Oscillospiraceae bacterium]|nr:hypothetical protein [Oscillospiraceae bacterium]